ncbi:tetratricopeptide repeat protein [uncultured Nevskia sp.]|uniref:tetratricopeptide repeat protein n=1 Tax=uncultured Nevskia sp. TaxID=228950 RepID=UPI0025EF131A|nr:tetratricopeptide repeat protein [uncultured Nevskia sp.]
MIPFLTVTAARKPRVLTTVALIAVALLAACVAQPTVPTRPESTQQTQPPALPPTSAPAETIPPLLPTQPPVRPQPSAESFPKTLAAAGTGPAVLALARQAQTFRSAGRPQDALGQYERALRIEPKNAFIWQAMAETHLALHNVEQAESAARKSNSLARGNPWLELGNWRVIASALGVYGDSPAAQAARTRADEIGSALAASGGGGAMPAAASAVP